MYKGVVWKDVWLGHSETFIRDQLLAMKNWDFIKLGFHSTMDPLVEADYAPYGNDVKSKILRRLLGTSLHHSKYIQSVQTEEATVIHAHFISGGLNVLKLARQLKLPLVVTLHNPRVTASDMQLPRVLYGTYSRKLQKLVSTAARFVAVSNYVADSVVRAGLPAEKVEVLPIGTPIIAQQSHHDRQGIVYVGRLVEMKGAEDLLQAVGRLPPPLRRVPVTIIGDGPLRVSLENTAQRMELNVTFLGWLPSSELSHRLAQHQIFCAPSKTNAFGFQEGFGMVFLEAALQGLPCVAYRSGGVVDAVATNESGILVEEGDIEALSKAIHALLLDKRARQTLGSTGRQRVLRHFDIDSQTRKLEEIFLDVQSSGRS